MSVARPLALEHEGFEKRALGLRRLGVLTDTELLLLDAVAPRFGERDAEVLLGLALALRAPRAGHVGVNLLQARQQVAEELPPLPDQAEAEAQRAADLAGAWPEPAAAWEERVLGSALVAPAQERSPAFALRPFVWQATEEGRLIMTRRMGREQERLVQALGRLLESPPEPVLDEAAVECGLGELFPGQDLGPEAKAAILRAGRSRFALVTGGPGTGKTYSIKMLLALLLHMTRPEGAPPLRIELAAPTGKAAVRMAEAMGEQLDDLARADLREQLRALQPRTLHRLLGIRPDGSSRHGPESPLAADLVVVDEASMVDLVLMRRLMEALPPKARLVLLGDPDQLASVEAGSVLADLVSAARRLPPDAPLARSTTRFTGSHRFGTAPGVAVVARALQRGDEGSLVRAQALLSGDERAEGETLPDRLTYLGRPESGRPTTRQLDLLAHPYLAPPAGDPTRARAGYAWELGELLATLGPSNPRLREDEVRHRLLRALDDYRVLAAHRRGPLGVSGLLLALTERVREQLASKLAPRSGAAGEVPRPLPAQGPHWLGRPLLVTENSYEVGLMNGDVGLVLPGPRGLVAVFLASPGSAERTRSVPLERLPPHTGALAMTVHKSQGSQFFRVALVLADRHSPIQTRELVYTAITRSSGRLDWLGSEEILNAALRRRVQRASGLTALLGAGPW